MRYFRLVQPTIPRMLVILLGCFGWKFLMFFDTFSPSFGTLNLRKSEQRSWAVDTWTCKILIGVCLERKSSEIAESDWHFHVSGTLKHLLKACKHHPTELGSWENIRTFCCWDRSYIHRSQKTMSFGLDDVDLATLKVNNRISSPSVVFIQPLKDEWNDFSYVCRGCECKYFSWFDMLFCVLRIIGKIVLWLSRDSFYGHFYLLHHVKSR